MNFRHSRLYASQFSLSSFSEESDDEKIPESEISTKSLTELSRSTISKNIQRENVCNLPMPSLLKNFIFQNFQSDKHGPKQTRDKSCHCHHFNFEKMKKKFNGWKLDWRKNARFRFDANLVYDESIFPSDASWLALPDREWLLNNSWSDERIPLLNPVKFDPSTGLGEIDVWIKRFLFYRHEYDWYYLILTACNLKIFMEIVDKEMTDKLVVLPYWCVSKDGLFHDDLNLGFHRRCMIVVIRNDGHRFKKLLSTRLSPTNYYNTDYRCSKIVKVQDLILAITFVSRPRETKLSSLNDLKLYEVGNYFIANPILFHAEWWILLLTGGLDDMVRYRAKTKIEYNLYFMNRHLKSIVKKPRWIKSASEELNVENCVVKFEPLNLCIGGPIPKDKIYNHVCSGKPFVFGFGDEILNVFETDNPVNDADAHVSWCVSNEVNTLLNLNRRDVVCRKTKAYFEMERMCNTKTDIKNMKTEMKLQKRDKYLFELCMREIPNAYYKYKLKRKIKILNEKYTQELKLCLENEKMWKTKTETEKQKPYKNIFNVCMMEIPKAYKEYRWRQIENDFPILKI